MASSVTNNPTFTTMELTANSSDEDKTTENRPPLESMSLEKVEERVIESLFSLFGSSLQPDEVRVKKKLVQ
jgi:hypothetical protein